MSDRTATERYLPADWPLPEITAVNRAFFTTTSPSSTTPGTTAWPATSPTTS
jgi:hypothetical protein